MGDLSGWLFGGTALVAIGAACWNYLRAIGRQLLGRLIATFECNYEMVIPMSCYVRDRLTASQFSEPYFDSGVVNVRPRGRNQLVVAERIGVGGKLYWRGWCPIWIRAALKEHQPNTVHGWFIRGTFNIDDLLIDVAEHYNHTVLADAEDGESRYGVEHVFGTAGKNIVQQGIAGQPYQNGPATLSNESGNMGSDRDRRAKRLLKWRHEDIGPNLTTTGKALDRLSLSPEVTTAVAEFKQWLSLESWYKSRGIPWRMNWLCYGPPGTGKSSIVQAIAEDHGLPIWVFDLATLYNDELHRHWERMLEQVPCIALIEDLDKVFEGSKNVSNGDLTLDCLLNVIDGVSRANGLFLVMTTNRIDVLDAALKRPGRADSILEMGPPDEDGLRKIARRILPEYPDVCDELAAENADASGAEFQRICEREALARLKATKHKSNGRSAVML